ncbi:MAG TPA: universal stress protein [Cytophagaceae bacterium]|nr:universal stress protein [Cytophagaceae bacterium]
MKNILVPTDFSDEAKNALKFAVKIAHAIHGKIILLHTISPIFIMTDMGAFSYPDPDEKAYAYSLDEEMKKQVAFVENQNVAVEKIIEKGLLEYDVADLVNKLKIDLVVTGTSGAKGLEAFLFETNSERIFEKVSCPVLIIPAEASYHGIHKIMYATDFQYKDIHELSKVVQLARPFNAQIVVTHVDRELDKFIEEDDTQDWFSEIGETNINYKNIIYKRFFGQNINDTLVNATQKMDVNILCMSKAERGFIKDLFHQSNTRKMAFHTTIPLMLLHLSENNKLK